MEAMIRVAAQMIAFDGTATDAEIREVLLEIGASEDEAFLVIRAARLLNSWD